jgi:hypothetical protein
MKPNAGEIKIATFAIKMPSKTQANFIFIIIHRNYDKSYVQILRET